MATRNLGFGKPFGNEGSSWADDDDDLDIAPLVIEPAKLLPEVAEKQPEEEAPARRDYDRADDRNRGPRNNNYDDRRGGHDDRRGGHERNYDDRRGGSHDRDNYRSQRGGRDGGDYVERPKNPVPDQPPYKIFVGNLPFHVNEDDLAQFLGDKQTIRDIRFPKDFETNRPKGFAYVEFETREVLVTALELDGRDLDGRAVKIDVASERQPRQEKSGGFFEKRDGGRGGRGYDRPARGDDRDGGAAPAAKERPRFTLLPRNTASTEQSDGSKKASIFGEAKPRDESVYLERQKAKEAERKKAKEIVRKKSVDEVKPKVDGEKKQGPPSRKNSHDDGFRAGGRGSTRGGRGDRPITRGDSRGRGGEHASAGGRGEGSAARGGRQGPASARKPESAAATPAPASRKAEPRPKRTEPAKAKIAAPAPAKIVNTFSALGVDSDSD
ncbi:hypothetical protein Gpo141_00004744 [Globisporangium polare]